MDGYVLCSECGCAHWSTYLTIYQSVEFIAEYTDGREKTVPETCPVEAYFCSKCGCPNVRLEFVDELPKKKSKLVLPDCVGMLEILRRRTDLSHADELRLRLEAWRLGADPYRDLPDRDKPSFSQMPELVRDNMNRAVALLEQEGSAGHEAHCLDHADLLRQKAEFREAEELLRSTPLNAGGFRMLMIRKLAASGNPHVQKIVCVRKGRSRIKERFAIFCRAVRRFLQRSSFLFAGCMW